MTTLKIQQRGAALLVSLILLLIMTLVGIAAIDSVTMQSQMARNAKFSQDCYQLALSEVEANTRIPEISNTEGINFGLLVSGITNPGVAFNFANNDYKMRDTATAQNIGQTASVTYLRSGLPASGSGIDFVGYIYELNSNCTSNGGGGSNQVQGLRLTMIKPS